MQRSPPRVTNGKHGNLGLTKVSKESAFSWSGIWTEILRHHPRTGDHGRGRDLRWKDFHHHSSAPGRAGPLHGRTFGASLKMLCTIWKYVLAILRREFFFCYVVEQPTFVCKNFLCCRNIHEFLFSLFLFIFVLEVIWMPFLSELPGRSWGTQNDVVFKLCSSSVIYYPFLC